MPNRWSQSQLVGFNKDQLSMSIRTQAFNYQCQTNGHDLVSYPYHSETRNYQYQTNGHNPQHVCLKQGIITLLQ